MLHAGQDQMIPTGLWIVGGFIVASFIVCFGLAIYITWVLFIKASNPITPEDIAEEVVCDKCGGDNIEPVGDISENKDETLFHCHDCNLDFVI